MLHLLIVCYFFATNKIKKNKKNGSYIFQNLDKFENPKIIREKNDLITNLWQTKP